VAAFRGVIARLINGPSCPLFLVDVQQLIAVELPRSGKTTFTTRAENWDKGKIYVPPGAKIVSAYTKAEALKAAISELQKLPQLVIAV
jgi:hypothetical protein